MFGLPRNTFVLCTTAIVLLGCFSRFTHGKYTPWFYAYQEYHQVDDGSNVAKIVPVMDLILGLMILSRKSRWLSLVVIDAFMIMGLIIQVTNGKRFEIDALMVLLASLGVFEAS